uniref:Uncharacterized protein n=1 Tax=Oryza glumipatula TaxID=40148 RepID=A0A0E0ARB3_9ORYZ
MSVKRHVGWCPTLARETSTWQCSYPSCCKAMASSSQSSTSTTTTNTDDDEEHDDDDCSSSSHGGARLDRASIVMEPKEKRRPAAGVESQGEGGALHGDGEAAVRRDVVPIGTGLWHHTLGTPRLLPSRSLTPPHRLPATATATSHSPSAACSTSGLPFPHPNSSCSVLPHNRRRLFVSITSATALPPPLPTDAPSPSLSLLYT